MGFHEIAGAVCRALTAKKDGPSLYDVCDPLLQEYRGGDPHLGKFYRTALGNPALRPLLRRTGLPALKDEGRLGALRAALARARDDAAPDWSAVGAPVAALMEGIERAPSRAAAGGARGRRPNLPRSKRRSAPAARTCCAPMKRTASFRPMPPST